MADRERQEELTPPPRRRGRLLRRTLGVAVAVVLVVFLALRLPWVGTPVANLVLALAPKPPGTSLSVRSVRGDWITHLELRGLSMTRKGTSQLSAVRVRARYTLWALLRGQMSVASIEAEGVTVNPALLRASGQEPGPPMTLDGALAGRFYRGPQLRIGRIRVHDAALADTTGAAGAPADPLPRIGNAHLEARDVTLGHGFGFVVDSLGLVVKAPAPAAPGVVLSGRATLAGGRLEVPELRLRSGDSDVRVRARIATAGGDSVWLSAHARPLRLDDLLPFFGADSAAFLDGALAVDAELRGPALEHLAGELSARLGEGHIAGTVLENVTLAAKVDSGGATIVLDGAIEDAPLSVRGWMRPFDAHPSFDLTADLAWLPSRLPGVAAWPDVASRVAAATRLHVIGRGDEDVAVEGSMAGAAGRADLKGALHLGEDFAWSIERLAVRDLDLAQVLGERMSSRLDADVVARGSGTTSGDLRGSALLDLTAFTWGPLELSSGTVRATVDRTRIGASVRLAGPAGTLEADSLLWRTDAASPFTLRGLRLRGLDPARLGADSALAGDLGFDAEAAGNGLSGFIEAGGRPDDPRTGRLAARGKLHVAPSRLRGRAIERGDFSFTVDGGLLSLTGSCATDAGSVTLDLAARPFAERLEVRLNSCRFDDVDPGAWAGGAAGTVRLDGTLGGAADWPAGAPDPWSALSGEAALHLDATRAGRVAVRGGNVRASQSGGRTRIEGAVDTRDGTMTLSAVMTRTGRAPATRGRIEVPFDIIAALAGRDSLRCAGGVALTLDATGALQDPRALTATGALSGRGTIGQTRVDSLGATFRLRHGVVILDTLALASNVASAGASGRVPLGGPGEGAAAPTELHGTLDLRELAPLADLLGADSLSLRNGTVAFDLTGPASARTLAVRASLIAPHWNGIEARRLAGGIDAAFDRDWRPSLKAATAEASGLRAGGVDVYGARARARSDEERLHFEGDAAIGAHDSLHVAGAFVADTSGLTLDLDRLDLAAAPAGWGLVRPARLHAREGRFEVERFELASADGRVTARGALDRRAEQTFRMELARVGIEPLSGWHDLRGLGGRIDGTVEVVGPARAPRAHARLRASLDHRGAAAGVLDADLSVGGGAMVLTGAFRSSVGDSLAITGRLPVAWALDGADPGTTVPRVEPGGEAELRIAADRFPLTALDPFLALFEADAQDGRLDVDMRVAGRGTTFRGTGRIDVDGGVLDLPSLGVRYRDVKLAGRWDGDRLVLDPLRARTEEGDFEARGELRVPSLRGIGPDLTLRANRALFVDTRLLRVIGSGEIHLGGTLAQPVLTGHVALGGSHAVIRPEDVEAMGAGSRNPVRLTPADYDQLESAFTYVAPGAPDPMRALYDASALDLSIELERNNWVRQNTSPRLALELIGDIQVRKQPHREPELFGRIAPVPGRGFIEQFGRSFDVAQGELLLNGAMASHTVNMRADYGATSDVVVHLDVTGTMDDLQLVLSSEPALSETDIVTYIATGVTPTTRSASTGSEAASFGRDIGLSQVTGALENVAQQSVGLDVLKVRYDALQGATLVAGRYVTPELYIGFRQPLQAGDQGLDQDTQRNRTRVELEYAAYRWLVLNLQGESSLVRSFIRVTREY